MFEYPKSAYDNEYKYSKTVLKLYSITSTEYCVSSIHLRLKYFTAFSMKDIFESVDNQTVIDFIKDANFHHQL